MNPPGWYPDPAGVPNRLRFWDGSTWVEATTYDPGTPFPAPGQSAPAGGQGQVGRSGQPGHSGPDHAGQAGQPGQSSPGQAEAPTNKWLNPLIAGGVALSLLIVAGITFVPRLIGGGDDPVDPPPSATNPPSGPASESQPEQSGPGQTPGQEPSPGPGQTPGKAGGCTGGNGVQLPEGPVFTSGGATVTTPDNWPWKFSPVSWTWMDDSGAWGRVLEPKEEDYAVGMTLGSLHQRNGFTDPQASVDAELKCISSHGIFDDPAVNRWTETGSESFEVDGMKGWKRTGTMTHKPGKYASLDVMIIVVNAGQPATLATLVTFCPTGSKEGAAEIESVLSSFKRA